MKLSLSARKIWALALLSLVLPAGAAIRHSDVSLQTYVDFATNSGRYAVGATNALLDYLRRDGVKIEYTGGQSAQTLPNGMISFDSVADLGNGTVTGYNYVVTVAHNGVLNPTFGGNKYGIGAGNAISYKGIEEIGTDKTFVHQASGADYKITRLSKLVTDAESASIYTPAYNDGKTDMTNHLVYRVGGGEQLLKDHEGNSVTITQAGMYTVAGIGNVSSWKDDTGITNPVDIKSADVTGKGAWDSSGVGADTPLPFGSTEGDSGSPYFVWNKDSRQFELLMAHTGSVNSGELMKAQAAPLWTLDTMEADNVRIDMSLVEGTLNFVGVEASDDQGKGSYSDTISSMEVSISPAKGYLTHDGGTFSDQNYNAVMFNGVETGTHTWKSLSDLKDSPNWYAYGNEYLNALDSVIYVETGEMGADEKPVMETVVNTGLTYAKLYTTQNLVFEAAASETYDINVEKDTDLGVGYLHFTAEKLDGVQFNIASENNNLLNSAGYVVDAGVQVNVGLRNTAEDYMREWRKVGEGTLNICGKGGNNEIFLNVGGKGETLLNQEKGYYAAYNVLVNTGSTVKIADTGQIFRDLTFGNGGGTLDMNGQSMDWYLTGGETKIDCFTINALTEEAVISNSAKEHSSLVFQETGSQKFVGSFSDSDGQSSLGVTYAGGGTWELNGIRTSLTNAKSGLTVQNGTVKLGGTLTVHGYGTKSTLSSADFSTRENDWHYADATMNVTVKEKAVFELESHARLIGTVTVESGGKYIMHEGVQNAQEYIEGGEKLEDTAAIKAYYGHKGDVKLAKEATLSWQRGSKEVAHLVGATDAGALTGVESTISAEDKLRLAASDKDKLGCIAASQLTLQGGVTLELDKVYLAADSAITSYSSASVSMSNVTLQLTEANTETLSLADLGAALDLKAYQAGDSLTLQSGLKVLELQADSLGGVLELKGENITLDMTALDLSGVNAVRISFAEGVTLADSLAVTALTADDTLGGYYATNDAGSVYFVVSVPEPATATLSLLALCSLAARRRRK